MNKKGFQGIVMKHTRYLVNGSFLSSGQEISDRKFIRVLVIGFRILGSFYLLGFCIGLLPFTIIFDSARIAYATELRFNRKVSQFLESLNDGNTYLSMLYRRSRFVYMQILKPIHYYIININSDARETFSKFN
jgi:hypothetical protein